MFAVVLLIDGLSGHWEDVYPHALRERHSGRLLQCLFPEVDAYRNSTSHAILLTRNPGDLSGSELRTGPGLGLLPILWETRIASIAIK
jgi:hypothetical protein